MTALKASPGNPEFSLCPLPVYPTSPREHKLTFRGPSMSDTHIQCIPPGQGSASAFSSPVVPSSAGEGSARLKRVKSCSSRDGSRPVADLEAPLTHIRVVGRGASLREGSSHAQVQRIHSHPRSTPGSKLDYLSSSGEGNTCLSTGSSPSTCQSPKSTSCPPSHSSHRSVPSFRVMSESNARLIFRSLAEAVHQSRMNSGSDASSSSSNSNDSSILFGACNEPCCRPVTFFAPEMVAQSEEGIYDLDQLEIWSLGVLLYKMLTGRQPFEGKTDAKTLGLILGCRVQFPVFSWQSLSLSQDVKGLIRWMLSFRPDDRPTIRQVLNHPWVAQASRK